MWCRFPIFFWVKDSLSTAAHYLQSSYGAIGLTDRASIRRLAKSNLRFLPHAVDPALARGPCQKRIFDVVLFADLVDTENALCTWQELFSDKVVSLLKRAVQICSEHLDWLPVEGVLGALKEMEIPPGEVSLNDLIYGVEAFLKAERIQKLVSSFEGVRLDVFGEHIGNNWLRRLKNSEWVYLHGELPYTEHFEVLKLSRIAVFDSLESADGCGKWFLAAIAAGCLPLCSQTAYLTELVEDITRISYPPKDWTMLLGKVKYFLAHPAEREMVISKMQEEILPKHSWEMRAKEILAHLHNMSSM